MRTAVVSIDNGEAALALEPVQTSSTGRGDFSTVDEPPKYTKDVDTAADLPPLYAGPSAGRSVVPSGKGSMTASESEAESDATSLPPALRGHRMWY